MILLSIGGTTSSGKSRLAKLAHSYLNNCNYRTRIINCDSRQIYNGLAISSGVDPINDKDVELIGYFDLANKISVVDYVLEFNKLITSLIGSVDVAIIVGGTGLYAKAITDSYELTSTKLEYIQDFEELKSQLELLKLHEVQDYLKKLDLVFYLALNNSEASNTRRIINHILRLVGESKSWYNNINSFKFSKVVKLWAQIPWETNVLKIEQNLQNRVKNGMIEEIANLIPIYGADRIRELGLGFSYGVDLYENIITIEEWFELTLLSEIQYAKRQITWFKNQENTIPVSEEELLIAIDTIL